MEGTAMVVGRGSRQQQRFFSGFMREINFLINLASTLYLTGLIWLVQIIQYPGFAFVETEKFRAYHASYTFWVTPVVAPAMILELLTSFLLLFYPPENIDIRLLWLGFGLTVTVWISTFFIQVPLHDKLAAFGFDAKIHSLLVSTNWIRTVVWSLRGILVLYFTWKSFRP